MNTGGTLGATTNGLQLGDTAGTLTTAANAVFNTSATIASFNDTTQAATNTLQIARGATLTVSGPFTVAQVVTGSTANMVLNSYAGAPVAGSGGALVVNGAMTVGANPGGTNKIIATVDLQALSSFTLDAATATLNVGNGTNIRGILTLAGGAASTNLINVATINLGTSGSGNANGLSQLNLGVGTNTIQANAINIGGGKATGIIQFQGAGGSVTIAGTGGGAAVANITIERETSGTANATSTLALAGHQATVNAGTVIVAQVNGSTGGSAIAAATFDTGTFNATSLAIANDTTSGGTTANTITLTGTFTLGTSAASTGVLNVGGNVSLVNATNTNTVTTRTDTATFNINGGTANIGGDIISNKVAGATTATVVSTLKLAGGTLNMNGHQIGHATGTNLPITNVVMPAAGQTATIMNLGGTGINDAGVNMTGAGTLVLAGTNTYTRPTTVTSGTLSLASALSLTSPTITVGTAPGSTAVLNVSAVGGGLQIGTGQTLAGHGTLVGSATIASGGTLSPGSSPGTLTMSGGTLTWAPNGTYVFEHDASATPPGPVTGGTNNDLVKSDASAAVLDLSGLGTGSGQQFNLFLFPTNTPATVPTSPVTYTIADYSASTAPTPIRTPGGATNLTPFFNVTGLFQGPATVAMVGGNLIQATFTPVPEPGLVLLACAAAAGGAWRRRRG